MSQESKIFAIIAVLTVGILASALFFLSKPEQKIDKELVLGAQQQAMGSTSPAVTLVEFSDFQCPYCAEAWPYVKSLTSEYPQLRFVYRHFPLSQHEFAKEAAYAAEAAGRQGKFWEMSELVFENQKIISSDLFPQLAQKINLNVDQWEKDMEDPEIKDKVQRDLSDGQKLGVNSTPTFYINDQKINLTSFSDIKKEIDKY